MTDPLARLVQTILHRMGQPRHLLEPHCRRHTLQRVGGPEDLVDHVHVYRVLLQRQKQVVQPLEIVVRLVEKRPQVLAHVHISHDLPSPNS